MSYFGQRDPNSNFGAVSNFSSPTAPYCYAKNIFICLKTYWLLMLHFFKNFFTPASFISIVPWCPSSNCKCCIPRLFFFIPTCALWLTSGTILIKRVPTYKMCPIYIFAGLRRLQFTQEQCGSAWAVWMMHDGLCLFLDDLMSVFGHVQKRT